MKQLNQWLVALVMCLSLGTYAQNTCLTATGISENDFASPSMATSADTAWYTFVPSANGYITITSCDKSNPLVDTRMFLYEGSCGALNSIGTSDNDCGLAALLNDIAVEAGKTYFIRWDNKTAGLLAFNFQISFVPSTSYTNPINDNICNAISIPMNSSATGNNENATIQGSAEYNISFPVVTDVAAKGWILDRNVHNTIWYKFVAPSTGVVSIDANAAFDVQLALFAGNCNNIAGLSLLSASDDLNGLNLTGFKNYCLTAGQTYYIMVDGFGTESGFVQVSVNSIDLMKPFFALTAVTTNPVNGALCPGENNWNIGSVLVTTADSTAPADGDYVNSLHYKWTNSSNATVGTSANLNNRAAGTYTITITDTCGNTFSNTVVLSDTTINTLDLVRVNVSNPMCVGGADGAVTFTYSGGYNFADGSQNATDSLLFYYRRNANPNATSSQVASSPITGVANLSDFSALLQGAYRVYVEDACGNTDTINFKLVDPTSEPIQLDSILGINPICPGSATGSINLFAAGGEGKALTYAWDYSNDGGMTWSSTGLTTQDISGLVEGMYMVTVSDPCGHVASETMTFTLVDPTVAALSYTSTKVNPTSFTAKNGSITVNVTGGLPQYDVTWTVDGVVVPQFNDDLTLTALPQGIYNVHIEDTCASAGSIDTTFVLLAPIANDTACAAITITANDSLTTYHNIGANATETGLVMPLNQDEGYTGWADVNINRSVWFKFVAPSNSVALTVSHYQGLTSNLNFDAQVAVYSGNCATPGSLTLLGANDNNFNGGPINDAYLEVNCLTIGQTYYVLVDGYQGVGEQGIFTLDLDAISTMTVIADVSSVQPNCLSETGSISINNVTGGVYSTAPEAYLYRYSFTGGQTGTIEVDAFGDIVAVNGAPASAVNFTNLTAGNYTVTVTDTCGNASVKNITIAPIVFTPFVMDNIVTYAPNCPGDLSAEIDFTLSGGGTPGTYDYLITKNGHTDTVVYLTAYNPSFPPQEFVPGAGIYYIQVFDGCDNQNTKEFVVTIEDPIAQEIAAEISQSNPTCPLSADGTVTVKLTAGPNGTFVGLWIPAFSTYAAYDYLAAGDSLVVTGLNSQAYELYVYDYCTGDDIDTVFNLTDPSAAAVAIVETLNNPTTNATATGSISYKLTGGYPTFTVYAYELDMIGGTVIDTVLANFSANGNTNYTISGLAAGFYRIAVNDACGLGLDAVEDYELVNPPANDNACDADALTLGVVAAGNNVAATVQQGESVITPSLDEDCDSFLGWCFNNGIDASVWYSFEVPASGSFSVEVASGDFDPQVAVYSAENCNSFGTYSLVAANDDKVIAPLNQNAYVEAGCLAPGTLVYVLVDAADAAEGNFTIIAKEINAGGLEILGNVTNSATETSNNGSIDVLVEGGVKPYTYAWSDGFNIEDRFNLAPGTYSLTVTDKCGTTVTKVFQINYNNISNDNVCNAILLPVDNVIRQFNNIGATIQTGETAIAPNANSQDCFSNTNWCKNDGIDGTVWFKFIAPSAKVTIDLCNNAQNAIDPQIAVYDAALCSNFSTFTMLGANDDSPTCSFGSVLTLNGLTPCATYYIMVDSDEAEQGTFGITVRDELSDLNAGNDTTITFCQGTGTKNLNNYRTLGSDLNGSFSDDDATAALGGSMLNTNALNYGTYHFTYTVSDSCGNMVAGSDYSVMTVVIANCTGINEVSAGNFFSIFPNPNNGVFTIENSEADKMTVEVFDMTGKVVYNSTSEVAAGSRTTVNLNSPAKGVYTIRINGNVNGSEYHRIVVQ